jgi:hypothetical protein
MPDMSYNSPSDYSPSSQWPADKPTRDSNPFRQGYSAPSHAPSSSASSHQQWRADDPTPHYNPSKQGLSATSYAPSPSPSSHRYGQSPPYPSPSVSPRPLSQGAAPTSFATKPSAYAPGVLFVRKEDGIKMESKTAGLDMQTRFKHGLKEHFQPRDPLQPPPDQFSRPVPHNLPMTPFNPFCVLAKDVMIEGGFLQRYFPAELAPHDVWLEDWRRFIEDIGIISHVSGLAKIGSDVLIGTSHIGATGYFVSRAIKWGISKTKHPAANDLVDLWNRSFFNARRIHVWFIGPDEAKQQRKEAIEQFVQANGGGKGDKLKKQWEELHYEGKDADKKCRILVTSL